LAGSLAAGGRQDAVERAAGLVQLPLRVGPTSWLPNDGIWNRFSIRSASSK
jgi:hypothetical protein